MNALKEAANDLKNHRFRKSSVEKLKIRIKALEEDSVLLKGISNETPVKGGLSRQEEKLLNNRCERDKLELNLDIAETLVSMVDNALDELNETERKILELFFVDRTYDYKDKLRDLLHVEDAQIYRKKDEALKKFAIIMYGVVEI